MAEIFEKARELGEAIIESKEYKELKEAELKQENDEEADTDEVIEFLTDRSFYEHIKKLRSLSKERRQTIYDTIDFWFEKEGRN